MDTVYPMLATDLARLMLAVLVGGAIGAERELRDKSAGFRTLIFICVGSTLFTIFSLTLSSQGDPTRIAAGVVSGVGFLGAGVILRENGQIRGLTTASTIWLVAALGMGIGAGHIVFVLLSTLIILFILFFFPAIEGWMGQNSETRIYEISCRGDQAKMEQLRKAWDRYDLKIVDHKLGRYEDLMMCTWTIYGKTENHEKMVDDLFDDPEVISFSF